MKKAIYSLMTLVVMLMSMTGCVKSDDDIQEYLDKGFSLTINTTKVTYTTFSVGFAMDGYSLYGYSMVYFFASSNESDLSDEVLTPIVGIDTNNCQVIAAAYTASAEFGSFRTPRGVAEKVQPGHTYYVRGAVCNTTSAGDENREVVFSEVLKVQTPELNITLEAAAPTLLEAGDEVGIDVMISAPGIISFRPEQLNLDLFCCESKSTLENFDGVTPLFGILRYSGVRRFSIDGGLQLIFGVNKQWTNLLGQYSEVLDKGKTYWFRVISRYTNLSEAGILLEAGTLKSNIVSYTIPGGAAEEE